MVVQVELSSKSTGVMHNNLIMQQEDQWQLQSIVLGGSLNLLVEEVIEARLINLFCNGYDSIDTQVENNYMQV